MKSAKPIYRTKNETNQPIGISIWGFVFLFFIAFYSPYSEAKLCWDMSIDDTAQCNFTDTDIQVEHYFPFVYEDIRYVKKVNNNRSHTFKIKIDAGDKLYLKFVRFEYSGPLQEAPQLGQQEDIGFFIQGGNIGRDWWEQGDILEGTLHNGQKITQPIHLRLEFKDQFISSISTGNHQFIFYIEGYSSDGEKQTLRYVFGTGVENQVQITGLKDIALGLFPNHDSYNIQTFCVYATGDGSGTGGKFAISGRSGYGTDTEFKLKRDSVSEEVIPYTVEVGMAGIPLYQPKDDPNRELTGSGTVDCGGSTNMTLKVELDTTFQTLSQLPAGSYSDVLTLTVEAR